MPTFPDASEVAEAIREFNGAFGCLEPPAWRFSQECRKHLLHGTGMDVIANFVWFIKTQMMVQFVTSDTKMIAAEALASMKWTAEDFHATSEFSNERKVAAHQKWLEYISAMDSRGCKRNEWSLASKVLHWLMPRSMPPYDSFVRKILEIPSNSTPERAFHKILDWEYDLARRLSDSSHDWLGDVDPRAPFREIDKYLWWKGGGSASGAVVPNDPWAPLKRLGIV